jgi:hypothetical protein
MSKEIKLMRETMRAMIVEIIKEDENPTPKKSTVAKEQRIETKQHTGITKSAANTNKLNTAAKKGFLALYT